MLTQSERQLLLDYLSKHGSDTVLLDAYRQAYRERSDATAHLAELKKNAPKGNREPLDIETIEGDRKPFVSKPPAIPDVPKTSFYSGELPKKLGKVGKEAIAWLKRQQSGKSLSQIRMGADYPEGKLKPQLALAIARELVVYNGELFEAKK
jgi:hypothetical protein